VNDFMLAQATFAAAVKRWPNAKITLRNGARIVEKTWPVDD
jgi:ADP-heptose:LPS heptosyltransferase